MELLFDTHAHYDDAAFDADRDALLASLPAAGVGHVLTLGCDLPSSQAAITLAERYAHVYAAVGIHPHEAARASDADFDAIRRLAAHPKVVAIGEIGLDYHYDFSPREVQQQVLRRQLELAAALSLPVCIHDREAHADTLRIVQEFPDVRGVFHCFSGSLEYAREVLQTGYMLSFTGVITFKNARKFEAILREVPLDRIMVETDCPYMTPEPHRGQRNDSRHVALVAQKIADVRGISLAEVCAQTTKNASRFFLDRHRDDKL